MKKKRFFITTKVLASLMAVVFSLLLIDFWSLYQIRKVGEKIRVIRESYLPLMKISSLLEAWIYNTYSYFESIEREKKKELTPGHLDRLKFPKILSNKMEKAYSNFFKFIEKEEDIYRIFLRISTYLRELKDVITDYNRALSPKERKKSGEPLLKNLKSKLKQLRLKVEQLSFQTDIFLTGEIIKLERRERKLALILLLLSGIALGISGFFTFFIWKDLKRFRILVDMTEEIARGNYNFDREIPRGDEVGIVAEALIKMSASLEEREKSLRQKSIELEKAYRKLQENSEKLMRSEKLAAIGRMAAQITHEIRNPLNAIGLNLELIEEDLREGGSERKEELLNLLRDTLREVDRLTSITEEYLKFARIPPPQFEEVDLNELVRDCANFLKGEFNKFGITVKLELSDCPLKVNIDSNQIRQAFLNIIRNAIEAVKDRNSPPPTIEIATAREGNWAVFRVFDNGPGISPENLNNIFDPFFSTKREGVGLGLALTQQIINSHGAKLHCRSGEELGGTEFSVAFPLSSE